MQKNNDIQWSLVTCLIILMYNYYNSILLWASPVQLTHQTATFYLDNQGGRRLFIEGRGVCGEGGHRRGHVSREGGGRSSMEEAMHQQREGAVLQWRKEVVHWGREETIYRGRGGKHPSKGRRPRGIFMTIDGGGGLSRKAVKGKSCALRKEVRGCSLKKGWSRVSKEGGDWPCVEGGDQPCVERRKPSVEREETVCREGGDSPSREGDQFVEGGASGRKQQEGTLTSSLMWWEGRTMNFHVGKFKNSTWSHDVGVSTDLNKLQLTTWTCSLACHCSFASCTAFEAWAYIIIGSTIKSNK